MRVRKRFEQNSEVEKERLLKDFETMKPSHKETPREYYDRINTLAAELRTVFNVDVTVDTIRRAFFKGLSDTAKTSFLQIKATLPVNYITCVLRLSGATKRLWRRLLHHQSWLILSNTDLARTMRSKGRVFPAARIITRRANERGAWKTSLKVSFRTR